MKQAIRTEKAPAAIGAYSQAVRVGSWLFVSGQIPLAPQGNQVIGDEIGAQTRQVLENLKAILEAAGATMQQVVKTTIYLTDLAHFQTVNAIYGEYFREPYPARATVQVAALPRGVQVEIDAIAVLEND